MKIYIDLLLVLNFIYDFLLLLTVSLVLKRIISLKRLFLTSFIGSLSVLLIFTKINTFLLMLFTSFLLVYIAFGYKTLKYYLLNLSFFYMLSIILGGFIYFLYLNLFSSTLVAYLVSLLLAPIILIIYLNQEKTLKKKLNLYYDILINFKNGKQLKCTAYIDSANNLIDPITNKEVIIIEKSIINKRYIRSPIYVPYKAVNYTGLLMCFAPENIIINDKVFENCLLGLYDNSFNIEGVNAILSSKFMEKI